MREDCEKVVGWWGGGWGTTSRMLWGASWCTPCEHLGSEGLLLQQLHVALEDGLGALATAAGAQGPVEVCSR